MKEIDRGYPKPLLIPPGFDERAGGPIKPDPLFNQWAIKGK